MEAVETWLRSLTGDIPLNGSIAQENTRQQRLEKMGISHAPIRPDNDDRALIADIYAEDFKRFGYLSDAETQY